jgi:methenyltetrahydromethanopterin cyclohydrolase
MIQLNQSAAEICREMIDQADRLRITVHENPDGSRVLDCGVETPGGLEAGRRLAEVCIAGLGSVEIVASHGDRTAPAVVVRTDQPLLACMASQYAGWRISRNGYFAMGSGPMRGLAGKEPLFEKIGRPEPESCAVGVLEASRLPPPEICGEIARQCGVEPRGLILLVAPTASQAGTVQIVARSAESAMHKLTEIGFDLSRVESAWGVAPLPPVAGNDLEAMGRTNDAILYGGEVTLWLRGDQESIAAAGPQIPSSASRDHGVPFVELFRRYKGDFYRMDPHLFGPAVVTLNNLDTGDSVRFGRTMPELLEAEGRGQRAEGREE